MKIRFLKEHYLRSGRAMSCVAACSLLALAGAAAWAQYPGMVTKKDSKPQPVLRAVAVVEWTGEAGKPAASRLVPVAVFDGEHLQDATVYLARPEPLALGPGVEYELEKNGRLQWLFDVAGSGQIGGETVPSWVGTGVWKSPMKPKSEKAGSWGTRGGRTRSVTVDSDKPVLLRKHHDGEAAGSTDKDAGAGSDAGKSPSAAQDSDRPVLKRKDDSTAASSGAGSTTPSDPDRPVLKRKDDSANSGSAASTSANSDAGSAPNDDPDRPTLHRHTAKPAATATAGNSSMYEESLNKPDTDRPRLKRGKPQGIDAILTPELKGAPPMMQQMVGVSDARTRPEHVWSYKWTNASDEGKAKVAMEEIARKELGLNAVPVAAPVASAAKKKTAVSGIAVRKTKSVAVQSVAPPASSPDLNDEQFRVYELAYGAGATLVLTASTGDTAPQKFITLIAEMDLYGNPLVVFKSVTDAGHLDERPRMRLVDAVDAEADNRAELLFELRGAGQRQFALYRVLRGTAEQLFVTGPIL